MEANYSESMLDACAYDSELKRRIRLAHTSNESLSALFSNGFKGYALHTVVLLHTSRQANCGFIAEQTVGAALRDNVEIVTAALDEVTGPFDI